MTIEQKMARGEIQDIVDIGLIVEQALRSQLGPILKALTNGRVMTELERNRDGVLAPDRILGRLEAYAQLMKDLEQFVIDKDNALAAARKSSEVAESDMMGAMFPK